MKPIAIWLVILCCIHDKIVSYYYVAWSSIAGFDPKMGSCCNCLGNSHSSILGEDEDLVNFRIAALLEYSPCFFVFKSGALDCLFKILEKPEILYKYIFWRGSIKALSLKTPLEDWAPLSPWRSLRLSHMHINYC